MGIKNGNMTVNYAFLRSKSGYMCVKVNNMGITDKNMLINSAYIGVKSSNMTVNYAFLRSKSGYMGVKNGNMAV